MRFERPFESMIWDLSPSFRIYVSPIEVQTTSSRKGRMEVRTIQILRYHYTQAMIGHTEPGI